MARDINIEMTRYNGTDYDTLYPKTTVSQVDGAQPKLTGGQYVDISSSNVIDTKAFPCNPNLLDNWYFGNPVNQRGQTSYTGAVYGIDRWKGYQATVTATVRNDGLGIQRSTGEFYTILQYIEFPKRLAGQTVTFSVLTKSAPGSYRLRIMSGIDSPVQLAQSVIRFAEETGVTAVSVTLPASIDNLWVSIYTSTTSTPFVFSATKLELGSQQTLAHQENGVWVLNEIPDYGEQLRRCQRYLVPLSVDTSAICRTGSSADTLCISFWPTPQPMRAKPVLVIANPGNFRGYLKNVMRVPTTAEVNKLSNLGVRIDFTIPTGSGVNEIGMMTYTADTIGFLSAEL